MKIFVVEPFFTLLFYSTLLTNAFFLSLSLSRAISLLFLVDIKSCVCIFTDKNARTLMFAYVQAAGAKVGQSYLPLYTRLSNAKRSQGVTPTSLPSDLPA